MFVLWTPGSSIYYFYTYPPRGGLAASFLPLGSVFVICLALFSVPPIPDTARGLLTALRSSKNAFCTGTGLFSGVIVLFRVEEMALSISLIYYYYN